MTENRRRIIVRSTTHEPVSRTSKHGYMEIFCLYDFLLNHTYKKNNCHVKLLHIRIMN
jgi:hypothetical protein